MRENSPGTKIPGQVTEKVSNILDSTSSPEAFVASAIVDLLSLDLGPPNGPNVPGVRWSPEYADYESVIRRGMESCPKAILILVGLKPTQFLFPIIQPLSES